MKFSVKKTDVKTMGTRIPLDFYYEHKSSSKHLQFRTHCHNEYEIIFFISGSATYLIEGRTYSLKKYDLIITRPMQYHNIEFSPGEEYNRYNILINHSPQLTALLDSLLEKYEVINCSNVSNIIECFKKMDSYNVHLTEENFNIILNNLLVEVCYNLIISDSITTQEHIPTVKVIEKALDYINKNLFTIKDVKEVCDHIFLSENHFFKLFKQEMKTSPKKYITEKRLLHARKLLLDGERPTLIYEQCGFNNYISFYQRYVDYFGHPPSEEKIKD